MKTCIGGCIRRVPSVLICGERCSLDGVITLVRVCVFVCYWITIWVPTIDLFFDILCHKVESGCSLWWCSGYSRRWQCILHHIGSGLLPRIGLRVQEWCVQYVHLWENGPNPIHRYMRKLSCFHPVILLWGGNPLYFYFFLVHEYGSNIQLLRNPVLSNSCHSLLNRSF